MFELNQLNFQKVRNHLPYQDITMSHLKYRFRTGSDQIASPDILVLLFGPVKRTSVSPVPERLHQGERFQQ